MRRAIGLLSFLSGVAAAAPCAAETPPVEASAAGGAWAGASEDARFHHILESFEKHESREALWWNGWTTLFAIGLVGQGTVALVTTHEGLRADAAVGAAKSVLGLFSMLVLTPRNAIVASTRLRHMDASTPAARTTRLRMAESLLRKSAEHAAFGTSWVPHLGAVVVNLGGAYVQWLAFDRLSSGWVGVASGMVIGEAQILCRPRWSVEAWNDYVGARPRSVGWTLSPTPGGMVFDSTF